MGVCALSDSKPPFDLDRLTVPELAALIEVAQTKRKEKMEGAKAALLAEFREKAAELGLSLKALMSSPQSAPGRKPHRSKGEKVAPKYRSPETGDTWTGRGREPGWIKGKNRDDFALKG
jgi:DNA-binding protein H-NS